jgi:hypothetical protein
MRIRFETVLVMSAPEEVRITMETDGNITPELFDAAYVAVAGSDAVMKTINAFGSVGYRTAELHFEATAE